MVFRHLDILRLLAMLIAQLLSTRGVRFDFCSELLSLLEGFGAAKRSSRLRFSSAIRQGRCGITISNSCNASKIS